MLRHVRIWDYVSVQYPLPHGVTAGVTSFILPWHPGWWWRSESQRVELAVPMPCGGFPIEFTTNVSGRDLSGTSFELEQGFSMSDLGARRP